MAIKLWLNSSPLSHSSPSLKSRYVIQAFCIGISVIAGVFLTYWLLNHSLVNRALQQEAEHYWGLLEQDSSAPLPNTKNLRGYLLPRDRAIVPKELYDIPLGYHDGFHFSCCNLVYVSSNGDGQKLLLFFNSRQVGSLIYLFGLLPLSIALIALYLSLWFSYRLAKRLMSPAIALANQVRSANLLKLRKGDFNPQNPLFSGDKDVMTLAAALDDMAGRVQSFVARERQFTQDVSHELRSPIAVIQMAAERLLSRSADPDNKDYIRKIAMAAKDMEGLTNFFLMMAREEHSQLPREPVILSEIVETEIDKLSLIAKQKGIVLTKTEYDRGDVLASETVVAILVGNLLRNALLYTDQGHIEVAIYRDSIIISDTGVGMDPAVIAKVFDTFERGAVDIDNRQGFGVGLSIVKRFCRRFGWAIDLRSTPGEGTRVSILFKEPE